MYNNGLATAGLLPTSGLAALGGVETLGVAVGVMTLGFATTALVKLLPKPSALRQER